MELPHTETTSRRFLVYGLPLIIVVTIVLAVLVLLDVGPFSDDARSLSEFIAQADQICSEAHQEYDEVQRVPPRTSEEAAERAQRLLDISLQEQDAILELTPPSELEQPLQRYLDAREEAFQHLRDAAAAVGNGDAQEYASADAKLEQGAAQRRKLAEAVGLEVCGH